ncbi:MULTISPECIES: isoprenyl transferase [Pelosinus]|jgi:undecaprenyl diphosphate synthase|uniref:Isoprenyl transferase n=1 Tax=Pelosinus fermentans B4 TaxID=1149862 RepID=I9AZ50_9FIRM|nr:MULTISPECIES: isoprenyl transferase [Pelosinus]EIW18177.1 undecaprenyl diphosphate synthase [Pelosinus fermentans B4]EIW24214.1 Undecaprenyl pyrophosphate synthase [Pelosinus fermentans A11]OAM94091.1 Undecaprenyl pyrophosphate synthase [Pelosinus fermentans DSM 17108]SDQ99552.1 undecaprenyl diphosphate synthase [Pelosinus fermentans]
MWEKWFNKKNEKIDVDKVVEQGNLPQHVAIIMDGNGRWAKRKGLPRTLGHRAGVESLRHIVTTAVNINLKVLTTYAFSTENWKRPEDEVNLLMRLFSEYLESEIDELHQKNVQIRFIGKIDELATALQQKVEKAQTYTENNTGLVFNLAVNYGGRAEIVRSVQMIGEKVARGEILPGDISEKNIMENLYTASLPDPDLIIRPSGDFRISNFLLWQSAYAEFWFTDIYWPDFKPDHFLQAIVDYQKRERRFGGLKK